MATKTTPWSDITLFLTVCGKGWLVIFLPWAFINSLLMNPALHLVVIGMFICIVATLKLPTPDKDLVKKVLGDEMDELPTSDKDLVKKVIVEEKDELSTTCKDLLKKMKGQETDRDNSAWLVAHRAACLDAPENSLEAVRLAAENGAKWVEFDISFSSDLVAVVFHDDLLDRVTTATGKVNSLTYAQLAELDLSTKHALSDMFKNVKIPRAEQFVAECISLNLKMIIDLKTWELPVETVNLIISLHKQFPTLKTNSIITSFYPNLLYKLRSSDPQIVTAVSTRPFFLSLSTWEGVSKGKWPRFTGIKQCVAMCLDMVYTPLLELELWWMIGISAVLVHRAFVTREYVDMWKSKGVRVMAWTVNRPVEKQFMREVLGVQVLTDTMKK